MCEVLGLAASSAVRMLQAEALGRDRRADSSIWGWEHAAGLLRCLSALGNSWDTEDLLCGDQLPAGCLFLG